jgi:hypothetical protein
MLLHLSGAPMRRPPFSDWLAQVIRACQLADDPRCRPMLQAYYDAGLSAREAAADIRSAS